MKQTTERAAHADAKSSQAAQRKQEKEASPSCCIDVLQGHTKYQSQSVPKSNIIKVIVRKSIKPPPIQSSQHGGTYHEIGQKTSSFKAKQHSQKTNSTDAKSKNVN